MRLTRVCLVYSKVTGILLRIIVSDDHASDAALQRVHVHKDEGGLMMPYAKFAQEGPHAELEAMVAKASGITPPPREVLLLIDKHNTIIQSVHDRFGFADRGELREIRLSEVDRALDYFGLPVVVSAGDHLLAKGNRWKHVIDPVNIRPPPEETESL